MDTFISLHVNDKLNEFLSLPEEIENPDVIQAVMEYVKTNNLIKNPMVFYELTFDDNYYALQRLLKEHKVNDIFSPRHIKNELADFLSIPHGTQISKYDVIQEVLDYIKKNNLQNPNAPNEIICDDKLNELLNPKKDTTVYFSSLPQLLNKHFLCSFDVPQHISNELADFLSVPHGTMVSNINVVKEVLNYIRENKLTNPNARKEILCDDKLNALFQPAEGETVYFFNVQRFLKKHFVSTA